MYIGLAKKLTNFNDLCFYNMKHSFCLNTRDGNINLKQQDVKYTRRITDGENVGVYVRISTGEVWFTINGKSQGFAMKSESLKKGKWYPTICMYGKK